MSEKSDVSPKEAAGSPPDPSGPSPPARPPHTYAGGEAALVSAHDLDAARSEREKPQPPPPPRSPSANERKHTRSRVQIPVCIRRSPEDWEELGRAEELTETLDCSRGGFAFQSFSNFKVGIAITAALPYKEGATNIFVPARIANARKLPDGSYRYGVAYVRPGR